MRREIKFRAWVVGEENNLNLGKPANMEYDVSLSGKGFYLIDEWGDYPKVPVMQYTGLKDKNGVEIYEGDILATEQASNMPGIDQWPLEVMGAVEWNSRNHGWRGLPDDDDESMYAVEFVSVIGNIYENPELLK